ncbi:hypothetical protein FRC10_001397 [Ceratobasidium sp. 414]|nr:hypothetical protein FRC10_001397 [Ceratobasidium sp. 414]
MLNQRLVRHSDQTHFVLNTASLHNYKHIQGALPLNLQKQMPTIYDRSLLRKHAAQQIRSDKEEKTTVKLKKAAEAAERAADPKGSQKNEKMSRKSTASIHTAPKRKGKERARQTDDTTPIEDLNKITLVLLKILGQRHGVCVTGPKAAVIETLESFYALHLTEQPNTSLIHALQSTVSEKKRKRQSETAVAGVEDPEVPVAKKRNPYS